MNDGVGALKKEGPPRFGEETVPDKEKQLQVAHV